MKFLQYLEKAWLFAAFAAVLTALFNLVTKQTFSYPFYFPLFTAMFCLLLYFNVRGQRKFQEALKAKQDSERASGGAAKP